MDFTRRPVTPGWRASHGHPFGVTVRTRDGSYLIEYVHSEYRTSADHGPLSYRYIFAVTFPQDGRRVEWTSLSSGTHGELIQQALYYESQGLATVTRAERRQLRRPRRLERSGGGDQAGAKTAL
jgi:hypothetical protein